MSKDETVRVLELEYIILEAFTKAKLALDELGTLSKVEILDAKQSLQLFAIHMLTISRKLAEQHDNRLMIEELLRKLKKDTENEDGK